MTYDLSDRRVAILATDGFEQSELFEPMEGLRGAGAEVTVVAPVEQQGATIRGWDRGNWGETIRVDLPVSRAEVQAFDGLVLPGGVINPDRLRMNREAVDLVRRFFAVQKPVAAICHAAWMLVEAGVAQGRRMTSYPSIRTDVQNAGATWVDEEVVVDQGLVTSRSPDDLPAFVEKMLEEIHEGAHIGQTA